MFGMKFPPRLDRPTFWMWVVPLVLGHLLLAAILMSGAKGLGAIDTVVIVWLAMVVAARFKDIGWPRWIAPVFMLGTMLVLPLVAVGFAIATNAAPANLLSLINNIGLIAGLANLLLLIVAGSVPGDPQADRLAAAVQVFDDGPPVLELPPPVPVSSPAVAVSRFQARDAWVVGGGAGIIVLILAAVFGGVFNAHRQQGPAPVSARVSAPAYAPVSVYTPAPAPSQPVRVIPPQINVESNGLTKSTNDFLRQLSQSPTNRR
jgi:hypothetical protein